MAKEGKRIKQARALVESKQYTLDSAVEILEKLPRPKFDETIDLAIRLGVDPKKAEENVRGVVALPHGTGKNLRVVVFCRGEKVQEAKDAGADFVGLDDLVTEINGGWLDFEAAVATPDVMVQVSKVGKILGPRGLMPNPKLGTVTFDIAKAVKAIKAGQVEYRVEKAGIVHVGVGKASFGAAKIRENAGALLEAVMKAKPKTAKGIYVQGIWISSTMGPSIEIDPSPYRG